MTVLIILWLSLTELQAPLSPFEAKEMYPGSQLPPVVQPWEESKITLPNYMLFSETSALCPLCGAGNYITGSVCSACEYSQGLGTGVLPIHSKQTVFLLFAAIYLACKLYYRQRRKN